MFLFLYGEVMRERERERERERGDWKGGIRAAIFRFIGKDDK
jgi:hypothetical protein